MGRKRDDFWRYVDTSNGNKCLFCGLRVRSALRIKCHLAHFRGRGIRICDKVPDDVKSAAALALNTSNKRVKQSRTPTNLDENDTASCSSRVSKRAGEVEVDLLSTTELVGFQKYIDKIWEWLRKDDVSIMGVWGMGGVGKTALLKYIHDELINHNHNVIWITVSQNYSIHKLQRAIAMSIDENIWDEDENDELKIAARLLCAFKKMNKLCVVILDDVWYDISLEDVGIPYADCGIRTIVVSRLLDVCKSIGCKQNIIKVECLSDDEDFALFSKILGDVVTLSDDIIDIVDDLVGECEGLSLAIVTMARSMRGKADIREWEDALSRLSSREVDHNDIKRCVFPVLKSSFDHLNDGTVQDCFLCLPFYTEDGTERADLKRILADEALTDERQYFREQLDEGHGILNKLINNSLLLESESLTGELYLHRLVEAMAVNIGGKIHGYLYGKSPDEQEWKEDLQKIYLVCDGRTKIPFDMFPKCPKLSTVRMRARLTLKVPNNFFINMPALKILDLSFNWSIEGLPVSICNLECLTVLLLCECKSLCHIPSLAKLRKLRRLDLAGTAITQIPLGFENLTNLRWLNLRGPPVMKARDLEKLPVLESINATFIDKDEFNACIQIIQHRINSGDLMTSYIFCLVGHRGGAYADNADRNFDSCKLVVIDGVEDSKLLLPSDVDELNIRRCNQWKSLCDALSIHQTCNKLHMSKCEVWECSKLEYLFCSSGDCILCSSLEGLNELHLYGVNSLSMLWKENEVASSVLPLSHLTNLSINYCSGMRKLLTPGMSRQLHNLEKIKVDCCKSMEEIFSTEKSIINKEVEMDDTNAEAINLPNLKAVSLLFLPQLRRVCRGIIVCGSLKEFRISGCPQLKCVPRTQPPFKIRVEKWNGSRFQVSIFNADWT